ncbi:MAG: hypothetical protein RR177_01400, partial [Oscillospiraceae bacterium]
MKKIMSLLVVMVVCLATVLSVSAASGISAEEQKILDAISSKVQTADASIDIPAVYINQAKQYLIKKDIPDADVSKIIAKVDEAKSVAKTAKGSTVAEWKKNLPAAEMNKIVDAAKGAAEVVGATLTVDFSKEIVTVVDPQVGTIVIDLKPIKTTGTDSTAIVLSAFAAFAVIA